MRIKLLFTFLIAVFSSFSYADQVQKSLVSCVDLKNYQVNSHCTSTLIAKSDSYLAMEKKLSSKIEQVNPNVMSTVQFFPEKMEIKVIAQKQLEQAKQADLIVKL